jgi:hypothetical protein
MPFQMVIYRNQISSSFKFAHFSNNRSDRPTQSCQGISKTMTAQGKMPQQQQKTKTRPTFQSQ